MSCCEETGFVFKNPNSILVVGPSNGGKTTFLSTLMLDNRDVFEVPPKKIVYCYGSWQPAFVELQKRGIHFHEGVPTEDTLQTWFGKGSKGSVLILDDLMSDGGDDKTVLKIFTQHSHHMNLTTFYLCQDLFPKGKYATTISRNAQYIIVFKNPRDTLALKTLLIQMYPGSWRKVLDLYNQVTKPMWSYLVFDLHPRTPETCRLVSHVLKHQGCIKKYRN